MDKFLVPIKLDDSNVVHIDDAKSERRDRIHNVLSEIFGFQSFKDRQLKIIESVLNNEDVFVIMPTGGGKSLCYALPAVMSCGVTIVISPLISLIEDQVSGFIRLSPKGDSQVLGIPAAYLTSTCNASMIRSVFDDLARSRKGFEPFLKLLYVTPERIVKGDRFRDVLQDLYQNEMLARIVIDEAHCVSSWGHDFRKDYGVLGFLKEEFPDTPLVALTATARPKVIEDTVKLLNIPNCTRISAGEQLQLLLQCIVEEFGANKTGIVYCMTKKECEYTADFLRDNDISADYYHAGQTKGDRKLIQGAWLSGEIKVVCATIAYGMGIDKRDVRYVIHMSLAKSVEGYYQEAGRAGRDGQRSSCIVFYKQSDVSSLARIMAKPPSRKLSKRDATMLEEMKNYCENDSNCRKKVFYDIFNENAASVSSSTAKIFDRSSFVPCGDMCDVCLSKKTIKSNVRLSSSSSSTVKTVETQHRAKFHKSSDMLRADLGNCNDDEISYSRPIISQPLETAVARTNALKSSRVKALPKPTFQRASTILKENQQKVVLTSSLAEDADDEPQWISTKSSGKRSNEASDQRHQTSIDDNEYFPISKRRINSTISVDEHIPWKLMKR